MKEIMTSGKGENSMEKDILNLLDTQNKIMLNILDLIADSNRWYTINEISTELLVVERTVQRYIHRLQELVDSYNDERDHLVTINYENLK
jgi:transcriptional antiterminator